MTEEEVLSHFDGVESNGSGWKCLCPSHPDQNPSLSIDKGDNGGLLVYCHAGCDRDRVLEAAGLTWADLYPGGGGGVEPVHVGFRRVDVTQDDLTLRHKVYSTLLSELHLDPSDRVDLLRRGLKDHDLVANQYRTANEADLSYLTQNVLLPACGESLARVPGFRKDGLGKVRPLKTEGLFIPVRLPDGRIYSIQVRTALPGKKYQWFSHRHSESGSGQPVHCPVSAGRMRPWGRLRVTEGPLKADVTQALDPSVATIAVASVGAWKEVMPSVLSTRPAEVLLAFDSDWHSKPQVRQQLADFWTALEKSGVTPVLEEWDESVAKGIDDLLILGQRPKASTGQQTQEYVRPSVEDLYPDDGSDEVVRMGDLNAEAINWLWHGWLPTEEVVLLDGDPGLGKSQLVCRLIASITNEVPLPGGEILPPSNVLVLSAEDHPTKVFLPRLIAAGADPNRVLLWKRVREQTKAGVSYSRMPKFPADEGRLLARVKRQNVRMVVVDPLYSYVDGNKNVYHDTESRSIMNSLAHVAEESGSSILVIRHLNKAVGQKALYRGSGNIGVVATVRVAWLIGRHPSLAPNERALVQFKQNLSTQQDGHVLAIKPFGVNTSMIDFDRGTKLTADELTTPAPPSRETADGPPSPEAFLADLLKVGPVESKEVYSKGRRAGFSEDKLQRAAQRIGIKPKKEGKKWYWSTTGKEERHDDSDDAAAGPQVGYNRSDGDADGAFGTPSPALPLRP